jgi:hypothetical protein
LRLRRLVLNSSVSSSHTAQIGIACGRPFGRVVEIQ